MARQLDILPDGTPIVTGSTAGLAQTGGFGLIGSERRLSLVNASPASAPSLSAGGDAICHAWLASTSPDVTKGRMAFTVNVRLLDGREGRMRMVVGYDKTSLPSPYTNLDMCYNLYEGNLGALAARGGFREYAGGLDVWVRLAGAWRLAAAAPYEALQAGEVSWTLDEATEPEKVTLAPAAYSAIAVPYSMARCYGMMLANYSDSEYPTGETWIDGKPLYRRSVSAPVTFPVNPSSGMQLYDAGAGTSIVRLENFRFVPGSGMSYATWEWLLPCSYPTATQHGVQVMLHNTAKNLLFVAGTWPDPQGTGTITGEIWYTKA
ncbi:MAG: hypothetical protein LBW85_01205 [Deltaproteobacteria bacterium]|jgi:hypothetical protein|nr:hypothetical protein [Deltaproteobacteria bacterium]